MSVHLEWVAAKAAEIAIIDPREHGVQPQEIASGDLHLAVGHPDGIVLYGSRRDLLELVDRLSLVVEHWKVIR